MKNLLILAIVATMIFSACTADSGEAVTGTQAEEVATTTINITKNLYEVIEVYDAEGDFYKLWAVSDTISFVDTVSYTVPVEQATFVCHNVSSSDETYNIAVFEIVTDSVYQFNF